MTAAATGGRPTDLLPGLVARVPVDLDRSAARGLARRELARPEYAADRPGLLVRALRRLAHAVGDLLDSAAGASPGGWAGLVAAVLVLVLLAVGARRVLGPVARRAAAPPALFSAAPATAADHRRRADACAAEGGWAEAVRERLRAVVQGLEERGLIEPRPGRTAVEAARDGGLALPGCARQLDAAARRFGDIWYGGATATAADDAQLRALDDQVGSALAPVPAG